MTTKLLLCDCEGSQRLDRDGIAKATGRACSRVHSSLCTSQLDRLAEALTGDEPVTVCCAQETETFQVLADEIGVAAPDTVDIRDRAGWSDAAANATPKIAALIVSAAMKRRPEKAIDVASEGICMILGSSDTVLPVADQLSGLLSVTCLLSDLPEMHPDPVRKYDIASGQLRMAAGALGRFSVTVDGFRALKPGGRGTPGFTAPKDGGTSECDIIVDLTGGTPLFPAHHKRDGYLRADPGDPRAIERVAFDAAQLVGTFEKTLHVVMDESLCAHSRAGQIGCTRCLDVCPTGAILPDGDAVVVDATICAGCGSCSAVCPSGAISYDAPPVSEVFAEIRTLSDAYRSSGGGAARLLVHDAEHGRQMISLAARFGRGLPADVIPLELPALSAFGHAEMMVALATGFASFAVLLSPRTERDVLERELALCSALTGGLGKTGTPGMLLDVSDPDAMSDALYNAQGGKALCAPILPLGRRRDAVRLAAKAMAGKAAHGPVPLPDGAPYGAVVLDQEACTLCLSCAGLCPSGALSDNPDSPQLLFQEDACLQCGLCATICPEDAITLKPRLDISDAAFRQQVLKEEEPYNCIECGKPFGVKSTVERIVAKLEGKHSMFVGSDNARLIRMCDNCRVNAQYHSDAAPFRAADRPRVRTTEDYLNERKKH